VLRIGQVAELLAVSTLTVRRLYVQGLMPGPRKIGYSIRFDEGEIRDWLKAGCPPVAVESDQEQPVEPANINNEAAPIAVEL
jgi:excisionase family DNA binding protein